MTPVGRPAKPAANFVAPADLSDRVDPTGWSCPAARTDITVPVALAARTTLATRPALATRTSLAARGSRTALATLATRAALAALTGLVLSGAVATAPAAATSTTRGHTPPQAANPPRGAGSQTTTGGLSHVVPDRSPLPGSTEVASEPLTPAVLAGFTPDATRVDQAFDRDETQVGFSTWVRVWQAPAAGEQATDMAVRFHDIAQSVAMVGYLTALAGQSLGPGSTFAVPAVPGGRGYRIPELLAPGPTRGPSPAPARTSPAHTSPAGGTATNAGRATSTGTTNPGQTVVIVLRLGTEIAVVSVDATGNRPGAMAIATAQATALAQDQYRLMAAAVPLSTSGRLPVLAMAAIGLAGLLVSAAEASRRRLRTLAGGSRPS